MRLKAFFVLVLAVVCLSLLFLFLKPDGSEISDVTMETSHKEYVAAVPDEKTREKAAIVIELRGGKRVAGPEIVRVVQGEEVNLVFLSDQKAELHLHGYDHRLQLVENEPLRHSFVAEHSGRFEYELHGHHAHHALGVIEVTPR